MPWVRLDDSFAEHPKIIGLSDGAFRTHVAALCYCNRNLTDGHIPSALGNGHVDELLEAGVWEQNGSGYDVHDYIDYQPSKEAVLAEREKAAERMRKIRSPEVRPNNRRSSPNPVPVPVPIDKSKPSSASFDKEAVEAVYSHWRTLFHKTDPRYDRISPKRRDTIVARFRDGFTVQQLCDALTAASRDDWPDRHKHADVQILFRNGEKVDGWIDRISAGAADKPFKCHCGQSFLRAERLAEHQSDVHGERTP